MASSNQFACLKHSVLLSLVTLGYAFVGPPAVRAHRAALVVAQQPVDTKPGVDVSSATADLKKLLGQQPRPAYVRLTEQQLKAYGGPAVRCPNAHPSTCAGERS